MAGDSYFFMVIKFLSELFDCLGNDDGIDGGINSGQGAGVVGVGHVTTDEPGAGLVCNALHEAVDAFSFIGGLLYTEWGKHTYPVCSYFTTPGYGLSIQ